MSSRERMKLTLQQMAFPVYEGRDHLKGQLSTKADKDSLAVVFLGSDIDLEEALKHLKQWKSTGRPMTLIFSEAAQRVLQVPQIVKRLRPTRVIEDQPYGELVQLVNQFGVVYVPNLTQNTAAKLAVGIQDDFVTNFLWQSLVMKTVVYASSAGIDKAWFDLRNNPMMEKTVKGHLETLKSYGMRFDAPVFGASPEAKAQQCSTLPDELAAKVITERHILSLEKGSRLRIQKGAKVTPLAREAAKKRQIELLQMEEGNNL